MAPLHPVTSPRCLSKNTFPGTDFGSRAAMVALLLVLALPMAGCGGGGNTPAGDGSNTGGSSGDDGGGDDGGGDGDGDDGDDGDDSGSNSAPVFTSGQTASLPENGTGSVYIATADDADGDSLSFTIGGGADASAFLMDAASGALRFATAPDFEAPADADADNAYAVAIEASDGKGGKAVQEVAVTVTDVSQLDLEVNFPPPGANLAGYLAETAVTGRVVDLEDGLVAFSDIDHVDVNGAIAAQDAQEPGRWSARASAPVPGGQLKVTFLATDGGQKEILQPLANRPQLTLTAGLALDTAGDRVLVASDRLDSVVTANLSSGKRQLVGNSNSGPTFISASDVAFDAAGNRLLVTEWTSRTATARCCRTEVPAQVPISPLPSTSLSTPTPVAPW